MKFPDVVGFFLGEDSSNDAGLVDPDWEKKEAKVSLRTRREQEKRDSRLTLSGNSFCRRDVISAEHPNFLS